ncbi:unnamed protein product [Bursaphelenchus okinawaensis]|uniref:Exocyst complex component n=1 Tax=Bursaphelenchus okinawaensis TaxID=465554 RepID=A0A811LQU7_9BILA|nr:unnamed protein product [Bursaphelenchus okinawaensis]CAG9126087.1 unnamed protein product [Bursaphelenchus okinawaensis]
MGTLSTDSTKDGNTNSSETGSTSYHTYPEMTAEQEFFLYELETTDSGSIGLVLRAIYDSGDVHKFSRALSRRIAHYDKNILKVCTYHYQGFLDSVGDLSSLGEKSSIIKNTAQEISEVVKTDGAELNKISTEIARYRKLQKNVNIAVDQISMCLPVLDSYIKLKQLMEQKKYLPALKVLEELEHNYIPHVNKYRFTQSLSKSVLPIRQQIRDNSYSELKDFLESVQKVCGRIGEDASKKTTAQENIFNLNKRDDVTKKTELSGYTVESDGSVAKKKSEVTKAPSNSDDEDEYNAQDRIDYGPIHSCCQVFNVLGEKEVFEKYYREQRREQIEVCAAGVKGTPNLTTYVKYLNEVMGFFIVEDTIMKYEPSLVTEAHKDHLWEIALQKVTSVMDAHFGNCFDVSTMLKMKKVILMFIVTMRHYDYKVEAVYNLLQTFRDQYNEIFMKEYCKEFELAFEKDNFTPIKVHDEAELKAVLDNFPLYKRGQENEAFPRVLPFSAFVPTVYQQSKQYLKGCLGFMENLGLRQNEVEDTIRNSANMLLERWAFSLKTFVKMHKRNLIQLVQITINMGYLEKSCENLERYITKISNKGETSTSSSHLEPLKSQVFNDARSEVEQLIEESLKDSVNQFFGLAGYDWELAQSNGVASDYITDMINFLSTTFKSFTNLPVVLARHVCLQTCKFVADRLYSMLLSPDFKYISKGALDQINLDLMQCELFASSRPVDGFDDATLPMTFAHIRQLLDLVMNEDWSTYLAERGQRNSKYVRVTSQNAATLLEKVVEFEKKSSGFFGMGRAQDRRKLYDTILRQLRNNA